MRNLREQILREIRRSEEGDVVARPAARRWRTFAARLFRFQNRHNSVYRRWCRFTTAQRPGVREFPGLPLVAFREAVVCAFPPSRRHPFFESSGTTGASPSRHHFQSLDIYEASVVAGWKWFLEIAQRPPRRGGPTNFQFIALMPSAAETPRSSLSRMLAVLAREFGDGNGFWSLRRGAWDWRGTARQLRAAAREKQPAVLFGTAFAWVHFLDWCRVRHLCFRLPPGSLALETGGYKGKSREVKRTDLHAALSKLLGIPRFQVCSEYSMCELSSQAYAASDGVFRFPPWCRARVVHPGSGRPAGAGERGMLEILDLANVDSCAFIRTEDLAIRRGDGFELAGRLPQAGLKGCSLPYE